MKNSLSLLVALAALGTGPVWSQASASHSHDHAAASAPSAASPFADAEVRKVDKDGRKITLKHGELKSLGMPPMTMVYPVSDASVLDKVKAGDKVRFRATSDSGKLTVTEIQPAK